VFHHGVVHRSGIRAVSVRNEADGKSGVITGQTRRGSISRREPTASLPPRALWGSMRRAARPPAPVRWEMPTPSSTWPQAHAAPFDWLSGERWCARLKWRAMSFQDAIEGKPERVSGMLEVN
jgi:hypothetical protein